MTRNLRSARNHAGLLLLVAGTWLPASAAFAATVTVSDITTEAAPGVTITVPSVELTDSNLTEDQVRALFKGDIGSTAEALADLDAASIVIPEIRLSFDIPANPKTSSKGGKGEASYKDIELDGIKDGIADTVSFGSIEVSGDQSNGHFGKMSMEHFDIGRILGFYGLVPSSDTEMRTVYSNFTFEGGQVGSDEFSCDIGAMKMDEFKARPLQHSVLDFMSIAQKIDPNGTPDPATMSKLAKFYGDLLTAFESTPMTFDGLDCSGETDEDGKVDVKLGGLTVGGFKPGVYPDITANDIAITAADGAVSLGNFVFKSMDLTETLKTLNEAPDELDDAWLEANARKLIPAFTGFAFSKLDADVPDEENAGQRIKFKVGDFDLSLAGYVNGIPGSISSAANGIVADLPKDGGPDSPFGDLAGMGIKSIDASYGLKAHWDQAANTIEVENLSLHGENLGSLAISGTIGNATPDLFSSDIQTAEMTAMGLTIKNVTTHVEDLGLGDIILARAGEQQGQTAESMRQMVAGIASGSAVALLGNAPGTDALSGALREFLMGTTPALTVTLSTVNPAGVGMGDLMALQADPTRLGQTIKIDSVDDSAAGTPAPDAVQPSDDMPAMDMPDTGDEQMDMPATGDEDEPMTDNPRQKEKR